MSTVIKLGDRLWHPCSMDIIEHKVISIRSFEGFNHYITKAVNNIGASGYVEVILDNHNNKLKFIDFVDEENVPYSRGLQDFVEGNYYANKKEAELEFYNQQKTLAWSARENARRSYEQAEKRYNQVALLIDTIKKSIADD